VNGLPARHDADGDLGQPEPGSADGTGEVAEQCGFKARGASVAIDRGRHRAFEQRIAATLEVLLLVLPLLRRQAGALLEVTTAAENLLPGAGSGSLSQVVADHFGQQAS
jgi:hypothetical protein